MMLLCLGPEEMAAFGQRSESNSDEDQDDVLVHSLANYNTLLNLHSKTDR